MNGGTEREGIAPENPYRFLNPDELLSPEEREWLANTIVAHVSPLSLEKQRDTRNYGGAEDVAMNTISDLERFGVKGQELFGNPRDKVLEERVGNLHVHYPPYKAYRELDLYEVLMTNRTLANQLERQYVFFSYQECLRRAHSLGIIHDHTNHGKDLAYFVSQQIPVVRTEHGPLIPPDCPAEDSAHLELFKTARNLWFIAISRNQREQMPDLPWIAVVHNGIDPNDFEFSEDKQDYLLFMGRLSPTKSPHLAIQVARQLGKRLIIAGHIDDSDETGYFESRIKPFIDGEQIIHEPGVGREARKKLYKGAACLLMLAEWDEPFGLVSAEAMMSGTPVVGFNRGAIPEVVQSGETGYIVDTIDGAIDMTQEVITMGKIEPEACRRRAELYFSSAVMVSKVVKVYREARRRFDEKVTDAELMKFE